MTRAVRLSLVAVPAIVALGFLSGWLSGSGYGTPWFDTLRKPSFMPPGWLFPVAWTLLYALMGVALARVVAARPSPARMTAMALFATQLALNLIWSPLFFRFHLVGAALGVILLLIVATAATALAFRRVDRPAAAMLAPYIAWLSFAAVLNGAILRLNP